MPKTKSVEVYQFEELDKDAKENARQWWRDGLGSDEWWDDVYEDVKLVGECLGIEFKQKPIPLMNGKTRYDPCIWFSGFSSQGDGACFEGTWRFKADSLAALASHAPQDEKLKEIAEALAALQARNGNALVVTVEHRGHYYHRFMASFTIERADADEDGVPEVSAADEEQVRDALRDFMLWIYNQLEEDWNCRNSDEAVDEDIMANEYEFTVDGKRWKL